MIYHDRVTRTISLKKTIILRDKKKKRSAIAVHKEQEKNFGLTGSVKGTLEYHIIKSLILAQDERWRRA